MGSFDLVLFRGSCPRCGHLQDWRIQYQHGYCRQHEYEIGDSICWFDPSGRPAPPTDHGENVGGLVVAGGLAESPCARCGAGDHAALLLRDNAIERVDLHPAEPVEHPRQLQAPSSWMRFQTRRVAGSRNEDRIELSCRGDRWTIAVADGAGGLSGGSRAAAEAAARMVAFGADEPLAPDHWCERFHQIDRELDADRRCGETTLVVLQVAQGALWGASVGDSGALLIEPTGLVDLTAGQTRKPLLGSGCSRPFPIARRPLSGRLLVATDGLLNYLPRAALGALGRAGDLCATVEALISAVTLPSGGLHDDVAVVLGESTSG